MLTFQWTSSKTLQISDSALTVDFDHADDQSSVAVRINDTKIENYRNRDKSIFLPGEYEMFGSFFRVYPCGNGSAIGSNICNFISDGISTCVLGSCVGADAVDKVIENSSGAGVLSVTINDKTDQKIISTLVHRIEPVVVIIINQLDKEGGVLDKLISDLGVEAERTKKLKLKPSDVSQGEDASLRVIVME